MKSKLEFSNVSKLGNYCVGEDDHIYRKPFEKNGRFYSARLIKKQAGNRYRLNNEWWSASQLMPHIIESENPIELFVSPKIVLK